MQSQDLKICPRCHRSIRETDRAGSLTSFLLSDLSCHCHSNAHENLLREPSKDPLPGGEDVICGQCGKVIPTVNRVGSMTAFFFKDVRCHCQTPDVYKSHEVQIRSNKAQASGRFISANLTTRFQKDGLGAMRQRLRQSTMLLSRNKIKESEALAFTALAPGQFIGGCYKLLSLAGEGGMGSVYRAAHTVLARQCAIKFLTPSMVSPETWHLFQKEAKIISSLTHQTICQIYDLGIHEGVLPYYAMDYIDGVTLDDIITTQGPLSVGATIELYLKVLDGLSYAHRRGVIHKDLKPANIMIEQTADGEIHVKILDFGISDLNEPVGKGEKRKRAAEDVGILGSAAYMSPEQFRGWDIDKRSDIYNLGCSLFETLAGLPPFLAETFEELEHKQMTEPSPLLTEATGMFFPAEIEAVIKKCMEKSPSRRYQSASEMAIDLQRLLEHKDLQFATLAEVQSDSAKQSSVKQKPGVGISPQLATGLVVGICTILGCTFLLGYYLTHLPTSTKTKQASWPAQTRETSLEETVSEPTVLESLGPSALVVHKKDNNGKPLTYVNHLEDFEIYEKSSLIRHNRSAIDLNNYLLDPKEGLVYRPPDRGSFYKNLGQFTADELLGLDLSSLPNPVNELSFISSTSPYIRYLRLPVVDVDSEALEKINVLEDVEALTLQSDRKQNVVLNVSKFVKRLEILLYRRPVFRFSMLRQAAVPALNALEPALSFIIFRNCEIDARCIKSLYPCHDLEKVEFTHCDIEPKAFEAMEKLELQGKAHISFKNSVTKLGLDHPEPYLELAKMHKVKILIEGVDREFADSMEKSLRKRAGVKTITVLTDGK